MYKSLRPAFIAGFIFGLAACSGGKSAAAGGAANAGQAVSPSEIHAQDYPNQTGQLAGTWSGEFHLQNNGAEFDEQVSLFINKNQTAIRMTCSQSGRVIASAAGIVKSVVDSNHITFEQGLILGQANSCNFSVPVQSLTYAFQGSNDTVEISNSQSRLTLTRTHEGDAQETILNNPKPTPVAPTPVAPPPAPAPAPKPTPAPTPAPAPAPTPFPPAPAPSPFPPAPGAPTPNPGPNPSPFPGMPGNPGAGLTFVGFAGPQCTGASVVIDPANCAPAMGFQAQSFQAQGQCINLGFPIDAGTLCQTL